MLDKETSRSIKISAASKLIDFSLRAKQQLDVEQRLAALELALRGRKGRRNEVANDYDVLTKDERLSLFLQATSLLRGANSEAGTIQRIRIPKGVSLHAVLFIAA